MSLGLVVEQTDARKCHHHVILVSALDHKVITNGSAGLSNILNAALMRSLDVVGEGEECVASAGHALHLVKPCSLFLAGKYCGLYLKGLLPNAVRKNVLVLISHVYVDRIIAVCAAKAVHELQAHYLGRLTKEPVVSLLSCKSGAVDPGLLTRADADGLAILYVAYGIGLGLL